MSDMALPYVLPGIRNPDLELVKYLNLLKSFQGRRRRRARVDACPIDLTIDLTTSCQLSCPYCSMGNGTIERQKLIMKDAMYGRILGDVGDQCFIIWYFSTGEPLLHKRFGDLVGTSKHQEIFSVISTNLSLKLSNETLTNLLTCGLSMISVSIDGATPETYAQYRRGGEFELVTDNIRRLVTIKRQLGLTFPLIEWRFLRFRHNEHEEALARTLAAEWGVDILEFWPGATPTPETLGPDDVYPAVTPLQGPMLSGSIVRILAEAQVRERIIPKLIPTMTDGQNIDLATATPKCDWLYYSGMIYPDGRVGPCCVVNDESADFVSSIDEHPSYLDLFNSRKHVASRQMFTGSAKAGTICDNCPMPAAQHYQFRNKVRAILRNAPDWVAKILMADPDEFFLPVDIGLIPEVAALFAHKGSIRADIDDRVTTWLAKAGDSNSMKMLELLEVGPSARPIREGYLDH